MNLNNIKIYKQEAYCNQRDYSIIGENKNIEVYFKNIENNIINKIKKYKNVIGCVAWLTNENILKELAKKDTVIIIIQEEDFLRPDNNFDGNKLNWKNKIYNLYKNIEKNNGDIMFNNLGINTRWSTSSGIRRLGNVNVNKVSAFPRMHNKFIICFNDNEPYCLQNFYKKEILSYTSPYPEMMFKISNKSFLHPKKIDISIKHNEKINDIYIYNQNITYMEENERIETIETIKNMGGNIKEILEIEEAEEKELDGVLLTGSYNYTENSNNSLENVVCIKDQEIIKAYFEQFCELSTISVELDWNNEWNPHRNRNESDMRYGS